MDNPDNYIQKLFKEGAQLLRDGKASEALVRFQAALNFDSSNATLHLYAGAARHDLGRYDDAVKCYQMAIVIAPGMGEAHNNLGNSLMALGRFTEAAASFSRASELLALSPVPLTARATALQALGKITEAENDCRKALTLDPSFAAAHWNLALNLLLLGRYQEGWREYEWRWLKPDFTSPLRHADVPLWDGSPLNGRTILLHAEQGFGDAIQFVRYAPMVSKCGGIVIIECHPQLVQLFRSVEGVHRVVSFDAAMPTLSCQAPLLTLPRIFGTSLQNIPQECPYIFVNSEYRQKWAALMSENISQMRIGLVWAGKSYPDPLRSCRLAELAPLTKIHSVTFYSLQLGAGSEKATSIPIDMQLIDLTKHILNFADTAAIIEQLDLIITIDTAVAHLAGALGKSVYLMLPYAPDWRWLLERSDSPWYRTMQIFRQKQPGDWSGVISQIHGVLKQLANFKQKSFEAAPKGLVPY